MILQPPSPERWRASTTLAGKLHAMEIANDGSWLTVGFRTDAHDGPSWQGEWDGRLHEVAMTATGIEPDSFEGVMPGLLFRLRYEAKPDGLVLHVGIRNTSSVPFRPVSCGIRLGLDTYMEKYPDWNDRLFPTLLRCEKTHFWGYCMSPKGVILGLASPDPIASWSLNYNRAPYGDYGHRIFTLNLDLMNAGPLPPRHPLLSELVPGEDRSWRIHLVPVSSLDQVKPVLAELTEAPIFDIKRLTLSPFDRETITLCSSEPLSVWQIDPEGIRTDIGEIFRDFEFTAPENEGIYTLLAETRAGKRAEAKICVRRPWTWYLRQARRESLRIPQKACSHSEGWLGIYTQVLARNAVPDPALDRQSESVFQGIVAQMYDLEKMEPRFFKNRIFNTAYMAGIFSARFRGSGDQKDLLIASGLADFVIRFQAPSGAYLGNAGAGSADVHYTCVAYPAKSIMEVCMEEQKLADGDAEWKERHARHFASVRAAMDNLVQQMDNIETEGELTFEDGMISCAATQLALFALMQTESEDELRYARAAETLLERHRCLDQLLIPDCRMNGGTLRFWEAQYDVLLYPNMMTSPHGWTSWKTYATWYLYLLTGRVSYLEETMNALGACMQMIDFHTGRLRWAFVPDPFVRCDQFGLRTDRDPDGTSRRVFIEDPARPGCLDSAKRIMGEQYVDMISDVYEGWCCDNDVHEHFKCLAEVGLASAYVVESEDGSLTSWNCRARRTAESIKVQPNEDIVTAVHFNLRNHSCIHIDFPGGEAVGDEFSGRRWVLSGKCNNVRAFYRQGSLQ